MHSEIIICGMHTKQRRGKGNKDNIPSHRIWILKIDLWLAVRFVIRCVIFYLKAELALLSLFLDQTRKVLIQPYYITIKLYRISQILINNSCPNQRQYNI